MPSAYLRVLAALCVPVAALESCSDVSEAEPRGWGGPDSGAPDTYGPPRSTLEMSPVPLRVSGNASAEPAKFSGDREIDPLAIPHDFLEGLTVDTTGRFIAHITLGDDSRSADIITTLAFDSFMEKMKTAMDIMEQTIDDSLQRERERRTNATNAIWENLERDIKNNFSIVSPEAHIFQEEQRLLLILSHGRHGMCCCASYKLNPDGGAGCAWLPKSQLDGIDTVNMPDSSGREKLVRLTGMKAKCPASPARSSDYLDVETADEQETLAPDVDVLIDECTFSEAWKEFIQGKPLAMFTATTTTTGPATIASASTSTATTATTSS